VKVLVTGANGFVGSRLAQYLSEQGCEVRAMVRSGSDRSLMEGISCEIFEGDIRDREAVDRAVDGCEKVFHIAALFRQAAHGEEMFKEVNVQGVENVLDAASRHKVNHVIHCSTIGVLGSVKPNHLADERTPFAPSDAYQRSKMEGEQLALARAREKHEPITVIRPAMIYGPGDYRWLKLFRAIAQRHFVMIGSGQTLCHYIYIQDLVHAFWLAALAGPKAYGQVYIIAGDGPYTLNKAFAEIAEAVGKPLWPFKIPVKPLYYAGALCEAICKPFQIEPPLYRRRVGMFTHHRSFNCQKAERDLGYVPEVPWKEGVRLTIDWYREKGLI
jgi:nucleoside-diphosphate-sugar epimerase